MPRVLGVLRLSKDADASTSIERQRQYVTQWAEQNGHEVVGWAEDVDVSGSLSPFDRPSLGPWLKTPERFDILAGLKLDRISRRTLHLASLIEYCNDHGKTLHTGEGFDLSTPMGKIMATIVGALAEGELEAIRERNAGTSAHLTANGRYKGGAVPYGYRSVRTATGSHLEIDEPTAEVVREIVRRILAGESVKTVTRWLNDADDPTTPTPRHLTPRDVSAVRAGREPKRRQWDDAAVATMLRSPSLIGHCTATVERVAKTDANGKPLRSKGLGRPVYTYTRRVVLGPDGLPLQRAKPLISEADYRRLQLTLDERKAKRATPKRANGSLLLRVAYCECGQPLYKVTSRNIDYYRCALIGKPNGKCQAANGAIRADVLEAATVEAFLVMIGGQPMTKRTLVPGENHDAQLARIDEAIERLMRDSRDGLYDDERERSRFVSMLGELKTQRATLEALPSTQDTWLDEPTGQTYRQRWDEMTTAEDRNRALRDSGMSVVLYREPPLTRSLIDPVQLIAPDVDGPTARLAIGLDPSRMTPSGDGFHRLTVDSVV
jgi:site-specific DNA recombinase